MENKSTNQLDNPWAKAVTSARWAWLWKNQIIQFSTVILMYTTQKMKLTNKKKKIAHSIFSIMALYFSLLVKKQKKGAVIKKNGVWKLFSELNFILLIGF